MKNEKTFCFMIFLSVLIVSFSSMASSNIRGVCQEYFSPQNSVTVADSPSDFHSLEQIVFKSNAEKSLGRALNSEELEVLIQAHMVGYGEQGKDGSAARVGNYTTRQIKRKTEILSKKFSKADRRKLMEDGVVGLNPLNPLKRRRQRALFSSLYEDAVKRNPFAFKPIRLGVLGYTWYGRSTRIGERSLKRKLTEEQVEAFGRASMVGGRKRGKSGAEAEMGDYTKEQIREQNDFLTEAGFTQREINQLRKDNVLGYGGLNPVREIFFHNFQRGVINEQTRFFIITPITEEGNFQFVGRVIEKTGDNKALVELMDTSGDGTLKRKIMEIYPGSDGSPGVVKTKDFVTHNVMQGNSRIGDIFNSLQSDVSRADISEADIYESLMGMDDEDRESYHRKFKGFNASYYGGLDAVNEWIYITRQLRNQKANPRRTHIRLLGEKMLENLKYGKELLLSAGKKISDTKEGSLFSEQQAVLLELENRVRQTIRQNKFTYEQWIKTNLELSELISPSHFPEEQKNQYANTLINMFPGSIVMINAKPSGIIARNRARAKGISVFRLSAQATTIEELSELMLKTDAGSVLHSHLIFEQGIFNYGIAHAQNLAVQDMVYYGVSFELVYRHFQKGIEEKGYWPYPSTKDIRQAGELILWLLSSMEHDHLWIRLSPEDMKERIIDSIEKQTTSHGIHFQNLRNFVEPVTQAELERKGAEFIALHDHSHGSKSGVFQPDAADPLHIKDPLYAKKVEEMAGEFTRLIVEIRDKFL